MVVQPGAILGRYKVESLIGRGGMGEVYRALDTTLGREVAIKALPGALAADPERLSRFEREAHLLASINHPHIAVLYGLERVDGVPFLAMELVPGESLAEKLTRGPIPLEDALSLFRQIAEALEAAHERGMVHRDLKPANVMVTPEGQVKVLDFGLAKALDEEPREGGISESPTNTYGATRAGVVLGTASYMSPEQARGKKVDARTDIWALGAVMYESLTGRKAFPGETVTDVLAAILKNEPEWEALPRETSVPLRTLLKRCLQKDPTRRLHHAADVRIEIEEATAAPEGGVTAAGKRSLSPWVFGAVMVLGVGATLWALWPRPAPPSAPPLRLSAELGADASLVTSLDAGRSVVLSPDGAILVFLAKSGPGAPRQLYVRRLDELEAASVAGTEGARSPFFSRDGQWIAFFAEGNLKKVAVTGGAAVTLCEAQGDRGGTWAEDGTIVFAANGTGLSRVSSAGGTPAVLTRPDSAAGEVGHHWPQMLPGGRVLYTVSANTGSYDDATIVAQLLPSGLRKILLQGGYHGRYLPSGHLVYIHEGTLFAAAFDHDRLEVTGEPAPAVEGVASSVTTAVAQFASSDRGALVYVPGESRDAEFSIDWMDSAGKTEPLLSVPGDYDSPRFSPDGRRLAISIRDRNQYDVWVYEWGRDTLSRLTFDPGRDWVPVWTPDGRRIAFASDRAEKGTRNLYWQRADGTGDAERLTVSNNFQWPGSWHPTGKFLAFSEIIRQRNSPDIMILPMEGSEDSGWKPGNPTVFLNEPFVENNPAFSPDGRWLAYMSRESGEFEVYVRPFPGPGGKWQVSTSGGSLPIWSRIRRELFYLAEDQRIMVAPYTVDGDRFRAEKARLWSEGRLSIDGSFDLHPEGQRFAVIKAPAAADAKDHVVLILNFFDYLRQIAPAQESR